jgi:hypothetical protein
MDALVTGQKVYRIAFDQEGRMLSTEEQGVVVADQTEGGAWATVEVVFNDIRQFTHRIELRAEGEVL